MKMDAAIKEIREVRKKISTKFNHSPDKLVKYYIELQKRHIKKTPILAEKSAEYKTGKNKPVM